VIVIDSSIVIFGSFNFTRSANERNDENLVVVFDSEMARLFQMEFERIYELSDE
jgi:phosphatidylserine/phosphatidylglycerophosphate/cardiolipin synthase-like enzyme